MCNTTATMQPDTTPDTNISQELKLFINNQLNKGMSYDSIASGCMQVITDMKQREETLKKHPFAIGYNEKTKNWYTYVKKDGEARKQIKRKNKSDLIEYLIDYYNGLTAENEPCIPQVYKKWADEAVEFGEIKPSSITRYNTDFKRFFPDDEQICKIKIKDITPGDLERFIKRQITEKKLTHKTYGGLSILIRKIFMIAKRDGYTTISITQFLDDLYLSKNLFTKKTKEKNEVFTENEITLLLKYLLSHPTVINLGIAFDFYIGLRVGELSSLKPSDINGTELTVQRTEIAYDDESGKRVIDVQDDTKTESGTRSIVIPQQAMDILNKILSKRTNGEYLFSDENGRVTSRRFQYALKKACKELNIEPRPMHKVRKTYCSKLLSENVDDALVAAQMGHSNISTTQSYYHHDIYSKESREEIINKVVNY